MANQDKIMSALEKFRKVVDKEFVGKTPKLPEGMDEVYDCDIYIFRHPGMGNSKQIISGNEISILTTTTSYLETLLIQGIATEKSLKEMVDLATKASKGELMDDEI